MALTNPTTRDHAFVDEMYRDDYFPDFLVDRIAGVLVQLCYEIELARPTTEAELLVLTHAATERINDLGETFLEHDSELETAAREAMAEDFELIASAYGFASVDVEDLIAPRDW